MELNIGSTSWKLGLVPYQYQMVMAG